MHDKFCRVCWNTSGWRIPTGDRIERGNSYVATYGFGHEEWLFNYEWTIDGFKYGYLQPIGKHYFTYSGESCAVALYTFTPEKQTLLVGTIQDVYIPGLGELQKVLEIYKERGWLGQMRSHVTTVGGDLGDLENPAPQAIANIRFSPENVNIYDPRPRVVGDHTIARNLRYHPFNWIDNFPDTEIGPPPYDLDDPRSSEHQRTRAAQQATTVDPKHTRLQNLLYGYLCTVYGAERVRYEENNVDLSILLPNGNTYFEIKVEPTARRCIRLALGQLLEYSHYPTQQRAEKLIVVGDAPENQDDQAYLQHLRMTYRLPIYYARFLWEDCKLLPEC